MDSPAFGQADLSNCERELIHLAGSVQPQGVLLLLHATRHTVLMASANSAELLGVAAAELLGQPVQALGGDLAERVQALLASLADEPLPLRCHTGSGRERRYFEGTVHRPPGGGVVIELEPVDRGSGVSAVDLDGARDAAGKRGAQGIAAAVRRFTAASTLQSLCDAVVQVLRDMTGYDRVMVYRFDADGHGLIFAEAKAPQLEPLLGHHYPASDIPQRARALYLRNRVRVLGDVHYVPQPLLPPLRSDSGQPLDMSLCHLRSMSPLHLQYLQNMGVSGTLVAALVREGRLWGLIAAHHYSPRHLRLALRQVVELLAEVASTRIAAIEHDAQAQVGLMVQQLEQRLIEATSTEGDWRQALFRSPRTLLQPLQATGAALFHGDEVLTTGEVPSSPQLRALCAWVHAQGASHAEAGTADAPFACNALPMAQPALAPLAPTACGVLAVRLSVQRPDYLMWFRPEQLHTVKWAGDPHKAKLGDDPNHLSPRRSFATWSELVRGTASPWTHGERSMARAIGTALVDIIVQVHAVRLLIAEHQLSHIRQTVDAAREPVLMADAAGGLLFANAAFLALRGAGAAPPAAGTPVAHLFDEREQAQRVLDRLPQQPWRGTWTVAQPMAQTAPAAGPPVAVRAEAVSTRDGSLLGHMLVLTDLRDQQRTDRARQRLERALRQAGALAQAAAGPGQRSAVDEALGAILGNASLAAMDIADATTDPAAAAVLDELEASAQRAAALYARLRDFSADFSGDFSGGFSAD